MEYILQKPQHIIKPTQTHTRTSSQADSCPASQDILRFLWNRKFSRLRYRAVFYIYWQFGDTYCFCHQGGGVHGILPS